MAWNGNISGDTAAWAAGPWAGMAKWGSDKLGGWEGLRKSGEKILGLDDSNVAGAFDVNSMFKNVSTPMDSLFRGDQANLAKMLAMRASGKGPSMTDAMINQNRTQGMNNISAQTASQRGVNSAFAARGAQNASASLAGQLSQQRVMGNLQEQQSAQQGLAGLLANARNQDLEFQQMRMNRSLIPANASFQEALQRQNLNAQGKTAARGARMQNFHHQQNHGAEVIGGAGSMIGMMSDESVKHDIENISREDVNEFLSAIQPKSYKYNNPESVGQAEGDRIGFVLQDVQHTKLGKKLIRKTADGMLSYDPNNLQGIILAALAYNKAS